MKNQEITIKTYNDKFSNYLEKTESTTLGESKEYIDSFLSFLNKSDEIFEVGTGTGRDANYIESKGFSVLRSDVSDSFLDLNKNNKKRILKFNILSDSLGRKFNSIFARAVLLHFNQNQFLVAIKNIKKHLNKDGIFAFTLKNGVGEDFSSYKMDSPRYFNYWKKEEIEFFIAKDFEILFSKYAFNKKWIHLIVRKK